jgi:hypothetical protein
MVQNGKKADDPVVREGVPGGSGTGETSRLKAINDSLVNNINALQFSIDRISLLESENEALNMRREMLEMLVKDAYFFVHTYPFKDEAEAKLRSDWLKEHSKV